MTADGTRDRTATKTAAIEAADFGRKGLALPLVKSLRLQQWAKNVLIFVPLILAGKFQSADAWTACILGFISFGLLASADRKSVV